MIRNLIKVSVLCFLVAACSSTSKKATEGDDIGVEATVDINIDPMGSDSGKISGLNTVNFEYDKAGLTPEAKSVLKSNADWIKANDKYTLQIEGHCDSRGSIEYNLSLGERRASTVKKYLEGLGIDSKKMSIISYGKEKLIDSGDADSSHAKNRRANFVPLAN